MGGGGKLELVKIERDISSVKCGCCLAQGEQAIFKGGDCPPCPYP